MRKNSRKTEQAEQENEILHLTDITDDSLSSSESREDARISYWVASQNLDSLPEPPSKYIGQYIYHKGRGLYGKVLRYTSGMYIVRYAAYPHLVRVSAYVVIKRGLFSIVSGQEYRRALLGQTAKLKSEERLAAEALMEKREKAAQKEAERKRKVLEEIQEEHDAERFRAAAAKKAERAAAKAAAAAGAAVESAEANGEEDPSEEE